MSGCEKAAVTDSLKDRPGGISLLSGHPTWTMMDKGTLTWREPDTRQSHYFGVLSGTPLLLVVAFITACSSNLLTFFGGGQ